jgi:histone-lysine N-methyltransferase SETMAR
MPDPIQPERIQELQWELLEHPPYSPDLAPSDFHLFGPLNNHLGGKRFANGEEVETEMRKWLRQL